MDAEEKLNSFDNSFDETAYEIRESIAQILEVSRAAISLAGCNRIINLTHMTYLFARRSVQDAAKAPKEREPALRAQLFAEVRKAKRELEKKIPDLQKAAKKKARTSCFPFHSLVWGKQ